MITFKVGGDVQPLVVVLLTRYLYFLNVFSFFLEMQRRGRRKTGVLSFFRKMGRAIHKLCCMDAAATSIVDHTDPSGSARAVGKQRNRRIRKDMSCGFS